MDYRSIASSMGSLVEEFMPDTATVLRYQRERTPGGDYKETWVAVVGGVPCRYTKGRTSTTTEGDRRVVTVTQDLLLPAGTDVGEDDQVRVVRSDTEEVHTFHVGGVYHKAYEVQRRIAIQEIT